MSPFVRVPTSLIGNQAINESNMVENNKLKYILIILSKDKQDAQDMNM